MLIHIKYMKSANQLGIVQNRERTRKNLPANIEFTFKIWFTTDLKRDKFIVFKINGVL